MAAPLSTRELELLDIIGDPVKWITYTTGEIPRWYQIDILRDPSIRVVLRMGRRLGKCVAAYSEVLTELGPIPAEQLVNMTDLPAIATLNTDTQLIEWTNNYTIWDNGTKPVYKLSTRTGRANYATGNHPFLTIGSDGQFEWKALDDLKCGDRIAVPSTYEHLNYGTLVGEDTSRLLGYLVGDSNTSQKQVTFTNFDQVLVEDFARIAAQYNCVLKSYNRPGHHQVVRNNGKHNQIINLCRQHGLMGKLSINKRVPEAIMGGTVSDVANFLAGYWDCDGWLCTYEAKGRNTNQIEIGLGTSSELLAKDTQHLLLRLGIMSTISYKHIKYKDDFRDAWVVGIYDIASINKFISTIPLKLKSNKYSEIREVLALKNNSTTRTCTIPTTIWSYIKAKQQQVNISDYALCGNNRNLRLRTNSSISRSKLSGYAEVLDDHYLKTLCDNHILWDTVECIEYIGDQPTYDLSVPGTHNFIADDIISHNTWSMCAHMLWMAFTHRDYTLIVATPYESQIEVIFTELRRFINKSPMLKDAVSVDKRNPQQIGFKNGSFIRGFTAGTKAGNAGGSLRGQKADWIYFDEFDYMTDADFDTISSIALEDPGRIGMTCASTPTGRRGMFWRMCTMPEMGWHQHHYPATINPKWNSAFEAELKAQYSTEIAWQHEVCAVPGTLITTKFGPKPIETLTPSDLVRGHSGNWRQVRSTMTRPVNELVTSFSTYFDDPLVVTSNHPVWAYKGIRCTYPGRAALCKPTCHTPCPYKPSPQPTWVKAGQLEVGDWLCVPSPIWETRDSHYLHTTDYLDNTYQQSRDHVICGDDSLPIICVVSGRMLRLLGYYLAFGASQGHEVTFRVPCGEPDIVDQISTDMSHVFGVVVTVTKRGGHIVCSTTNILLAQLLSKLCGTNAVDKALHPNLYYMSDANVLAIICAYWRGAGVFDIVSSKHVCKATVESTQLAHQLHQALLHNNILTSLHKVRNHYVLEATGTMLDNMATTVFKKSVSVPTKAYSRWFKHNNVWYLNVRNVSSTNYQGNVYNLSVDTDESYCMPLKCVHNCAEFGEEAVGVFRKDYIDRARATYDYTYYPDYEAIRTIGVDWDKYGAETQIIVLEYDKIEQKFKILLRVAVPKSEFTLHHAVNKIIQLNEAFNPIAIYVDRGFGEYQVELLHLHGDTHPASGLREKVKGIAFGSAQEVRDPITHEIRTTPMKPFMVNQVVYYLEQDLLTINDDDSEVWKQLENYQVVRVTPTGQPVFSSENEHCVDALMLAVTAFQLERPELADIMKGQKVARHMNTQALKISDPISAMFTAAPLTNKQKIKWDEPGPPPPQKVPLGTLPKAKSGKQWQRGTNNRLPSRKSW